MEYNLSRQISCQSNILDRGVPGRKIYLAPSNEKQGRVDINPRNTGDMGQGKDEYYVMAMPEV